MLLDLGFITLELQPHVSKTIQDKRIQKVLNPPGSLFPEFYTSSNDEIETGIGENL